MRWALDEVRYVFSLYKVYKAHHRHPFNMDFDRNYNGLITLDADLEWNTNWLLGKRCSPKLDTHAAVRTPELRRNE